MLITALVDHGNKVVVLEDIFLHKKNWTLGEIA